VTIVDPRAKLEIYARRGDELADLIIQRFARRHPKAMRTLGKHWGTASSPRLYPVVAGLPRPARECMLPEDWKEYRALPEIVEIYRGVDDATVAGCSWTEQYIYAREAATWVGHREKSRPRVLIGRVAKNRIAFVRARKRMIDPLSGLVLYNGLPCGEVVVPFHDVQVVGEDEIPADELAAHAAAVDEALREGALQLVSDDPVRTVEQRKFGRNEPCPCGSGRKFKRCCHP